MLNIEVIRRDYDLISLAEQAGAHLAQRGGEYRSACPLHKGDNPTGFVIYESKGRQMWKCYTGNCGHGDVFDFMAARDGVTLAQVFAQIKSGQTPEPKPATEADILRRLQELERKQAEHERRVTDLEKWRKSAPWEKYHEQAPERARAEWRAAGIPDDWQAFWRLGGAASFAYTGNDGEHYASPTLTIPIYAPHYETVATVRHRLLDPADPGDKYRPDMAGLGSHPFLADPDLGFDIANRTIIVEGEKKAMVTFITLDQANTQVIGLPGKSIWRETAAKLTGQDVVIIPDPDAYQDALKLAQVIGGAIVVQYGRKIDDTINQFGMGSQWVNGLINTGKFVK
jgi:hypothetical protein